MTTNLLNLLPCPFCGTDQIAVCCTDQEWFIECQGCEAELRWFQSRNEAVDRWNTRTTLPSTVSVPHE